MLISRALATIFTLSTVAVANDVSLHNQQLSVTIREQDGSYQIAEKDNAQPVLRSIVGAQVDHRWLKSSQYPKHEISESGFEDVLGRGRQITVTSTGLAHKPDLIYVLRLYDKHPYGDIQVEVRNRTVKTVTVQSIRSVDAIGERILDLGGPDRADRVLPETFSTDLTTKRIAYLSTPPQGRH